MSQFTTSHSPPPLRHPVPTHPAYIPEPPSTPASPQGYQRYSSSPAPAGNPHGAPQQHHAGGIGQSNLVGHGQGPIPVLGGQGGYGMQGNVGGGGGGGPVPYTSPFQHSQGYGPGPGAGGGGPYGGMGGQRPPPGQGPYGGVGGPGAGGGWAFDNATAQLGMQIGQNAVAAGQEYVQRNFGTIIPSTTLKHHFNVSNLYVMKKLQLVLFPWRHKPWTRKPRGQGEFFPPRDDVNAPDLYIPVMAMVTYVLLGSLYAGLVHQNFHPQLLGELTSRAVAVVFVDFVLVKLGCYILNIQGSSQVIDLVAYGGYKFVGVNLTIAASILHLRGAVWSFIFIYAFFANAFFLLRSLRAVVLPDASGAQGAATVTPATRRRRITFLFLEAVSQVLYMWWLARV